jgi:NADPH-dependent 2,4-dienoyl-CoA reductase/sulfur reductase-like enzyme
MNILLGRNVNFALGNKIRMGFSQYDLVVIGGGPGGYVAAIKAA